MPSPIAVEVVLSEPEREQLVSWSRRRTSAQALATRSRIVLAASEGLSNTQIAEQLGVHRNTVRIWRTRFVADRLDGLVDEPRPGPPRTITDAQVERGDHHDAWRPSPRTRRTGRRGRWLRRLG